MNLRELPDYQILAIVLARLHEYGESCLTQANWALIRLTEAKLLPDKLLLTEAIWQRRAYLERHQENRGYVLQAALWTARGFGIIHWEAEEFWKHHQQVDLEPHARSRFKPFENCNATERSLIGQQAFALFEQLSLQFETPV